MKTTYLYQKVNTAGEITAVITTPVPTRQQALLARQIMKTETKVEQVAFLSLSKDKLPALRMMGRELSVNGAVAGAFVLMKLRNQSKIVLKISTLPCPINITRENNMVTAIFPESLVQSINQSQVTLSGITYLLIREFPEEMLLTNNQKIILKKLTKNTPAAGIIFYKDDQIKPVVYVKATQSFVWEQACGSGSIAFALLSGKSIIKQPSGDKVCVRISQNCLIYRTKTSLITTKGGEQYE